MERILKILALTLCLLATPVAWAAAKAGDILLAQGAAFVRSTTGAERAAAVGMAVESGETLVTRDGRLQVRLPMAESPASSPNRSSRLPITGSWAKARRRNRRYSS